MKAAVLGAGRMGRVHIEALGLLGLDVVGVCDHKSDNLKLVAEIVSEASPILCNDATTLFAQCQPDVVGIATTSPAHASLTELAIDQDVKTIICEKPFANSVLAANRLAERAEVYEGVLAVNHQMRFMDQYVKVRELLDSGDVGRLTSMNVLGGNFGLATNGSHYFEAFRYLADEPLVSIQAWLDEAELPNPRGPQFKDVSGVVQGRSRSGARFHMDASFDQGHGMAVHYGTEFGQIYVSEFDGEIHYSHRKREHLDTPTTRYGMPWERKSVAFNPPDNLGPTKAVYAAALNGENYPTAREGASVVRLLAACYHSSRNGGAVIRADDPALDETEVFPWP